MVDREESRLATRSRVLKEARHLFLTDGFSATTIRGIAARAGVSVGTVIAVGDKDALLVHIMDALIAELHRDTTRSSRDIVPDLIARVTPFVELFAMHPELGRSYASILMRGTQGSTIFTELAKTLENEFAHTLDSYDQDTSLAFTIYTIYLGLLFRWAAAAELESATFLDDFRSALHPLFP